jgi:hypothetical protein
MGALVDVPDVDDDGYYDAWDIGAEPGEPSGPFWLAEPADAPPARAEPLDYSLEREIGTLRALLDRMAGIVGATDDPERLVLPLTRLVEAIARTLRAQALLRGGPETEMSRALNAILEEIGLGEEH